MNELAWRKALEQEAGPLDRLAYADFLEERQMDCQALTQRLLVMGNYGFDGSCWVLNLDPLPAEVRDTIFAYRKSVGNDNPTLATEKRFVIEALVLEVVYDLLGKGTVLTVKTEALVECCTPQPESSDTPQKA